jgi:hypothetical protein
MANKVSRGEPVVVSTPHTSPLSSPKITRKSSKSPESPEQRIDKLRHRLETGAQPNSDMQSPTRPSRAAFLKSPFGSPVRPMIAPESVEKVTPRTETAARLSKVELSSPSTTKKWPALPDLTTKQEAASSRALVLKDPRTLILTGGDDESSNEGDELPVTSVTRTALLVNQAVDVFRSGVSPSSMAPAAKPASEKPTRVSPKPLSVVPELAIAKAPMETRSKTHRKELSDLISKCDLKFFECAKGNSSKKALSWEEFLPVFGLFKDILLSIESREFLDGYLVKDSHVGKNKDPEQQKAFKALDEKLNKLKDALEAIGIAGLKEEQTINFWSGREGQRRAAEDTCSFSDSDVPMFKFLFDCWGCLKNRELYKDHPSPFLTNLLPDLLSSLFVRHLSFVKKAVDVNVYMSSTNNPKEDGSTPFNDSAFWRAECRALMDNPNVRHLYLFLHNTKDQQNNDLWMKPIDLKSQDPQEIAYRNEILFISRRGEADLKVRVKTLVDMAQEWKAIAKRKKLLKESTC